MRIIVLIISICFLSACKAPPPPIPVPETSYVTGGKPSACESLSYKGFPKLNTPRADTYFICRPEIYAINYDPVRKNAIWISYRLSENDIKPMDRSVDDSVIDYRPDPLIPDKLQSKKDDYFSNGYEKGHLMPSEISNSSVPKLSSSYYLSAIIPRNDLYNNVWAELNNAASYWVSSGKDVYVISGPIFNQNGSWIGVPDNKSAIGKKARVGQIAVPDKIFIIFIDAKSNQSIAFIVPNKELSGDEKVLPAPYYASSISSVESYANITIAPDIDTKLESDVIKNSVSPEFWAWPAKKD